MQTTQSQTKKHIHMNVKLSKTPRLKDSADFLELNYL